LGLTQKVCQCTSDCRASAVWNCKVYSSGLTASE